MEKNQVEKHIRNNSQDQETASWEEKDMAEA